MLCTILYGNGRKDGCIFFQFQGVSWDDQTDFHGGERFRTRENQRPKIKVSKFIES